MPSGSALGDRSRNVRIALVDRCQRREGDFSRGGECMATGGLDNVEHRCHELGSQNPQLVLMVLRKVLRMKPMHAKHAKPGRRFGSLSQECDAHRRAHDLGTAVIARYRVEKSVQHDRGIFTGLMSFHAGNQSESQGVVHEIGFEMQFVFPFETREYSIDDAGNPAIDMIRRQRCRRAQALDLSTRRAIPPASVLARQVPQKAPPLVFAECAVRRRGDGGRPVRPEKTMDGNLPNASQFGP